jgi:hypothetical protein
MTRYGQIGWRIAAVAAFAGTAALAVILTRAPIRSAATLSSAVTGRTCPSSELEAWLGLGTASADGAGGAGMHGPYGTYYSLEFTNLSHHACSLYGYPEVSAVTDSRVMRGQIGSAAIRDTSVRPRPVMLAPGATAHSVLRVIVTSGPQPAGCAQVTAEELQVTLPRQGRSVFVPVHIPVCSKKGHASLSVQAIQARPGVPGYTMVP